MTTTTGNKHPTDWLNAFLPLGCTRDDTWQPRGAGVLLLDRPIVWLVTARAVVETLDDDELTTFIPSDQGPGLLNLTKVQQQTGMPWVHHPVGLSAMMLPLDQSFRIKAFAETQCARVRDLQPLQPAASVGFLYGHDSEPQPHPTPAVFDGIISASNSTSGTIFSTAPLLPRNIGAPLLLASPYGGQVSLAGILLDNTMVSEADPRLLPVRLGRAICVDAALELVRGKDATEQRRRVTAPDAAPTPDAPAAEETEE